MALQHPCILIFLYYFLLNTSPVDSEQLQFDNAKVYLESHPEVLSQVLTSIHKTKEEVYHLLDDSHTFLTVVTKPDATIFARLIIMCPPDDSAMVQNTVTIDLSNVNTAGRRAIAYDQLHSRPLSKKKLYLDFNGHDLSNTAWAQYQGGVLPVSSCFDTGFADTLLVKYIWERIAAAFFPFDIDVTTEYVGGNEDFLTRSSVSDEYYGERILFAPATRNKVSSKNVAGLAFVGSFDDYDVYGKTALVFPDVAGGHILLSFHATHEAGHTLGLYHDGFGASEYYSGHADWRPFMGTIITSVAYTQWSKGEYYSATNQQDDLAVIASYVGVPLDDYSNTMDVTQNVVSAVSSIIMKGFIGIAGDVDCVSFCSFQSTFTYTMNAVSGNMDNSDPFMRSYTPLKIEGTLFSQDKRPLFTTGGSYYSYELPYDGVYFLCVKGVGQGSPMANPPSGFTSYGSIGAYDGSIMFQGTSNPTCRSFVLAITTSAVVSTTMVSTTRATTSAEITSTMLRTSTTTADIVKAQVKFSVSVAMDAGNTSALQTFKQVLSVVLQVPVSAIDLIPRSNNSASIIQRRLFATAATLFDITVNYGTNTDAVAAASTLSSNVNTLNTNLVMQGLAAVTVVDPPVVVDGSGVVISTSVQSTGIVVGNTTITTTTASSSSSSSSQLTMETIIGIIVGSVAFAAVVAGLLVYLYKRSPNVQSRSPQYTSVSQQDENKRGQRVVQVPSRWVSGK